MSNATATPDPPWHRRSRLWRHEPEIRRLEAEGADSARDREALAALDASGFTPPTPRIPK
jgi:hypothetical protein